MATTKTFSTLVANATSAVQGAYAGLVDFTVGSISLAYMQAVSAIALWLQGIALQIASLTRLSTSTGTDVDSFLADFGTKRLGGVQAKGAVTFSRFTPTVSAVIPAGTIVQTADGTQTFAVIADITQGDWNAGLNAYVIASGTTSGQASIEAVTAGIAGNVAAGIITVIGTSIVGIDTVSNSSALSGGADEQSDTQARAEFVLYLQSLTQGTKQACINAVLELQKNAACYLTENLTYSPPGLPQPGYFYCVVDDGTGSPSTDFINAAYAAVDKVRAEGTIFGVYAPQIVDGNVTLTVKVASGYNSTTVQSQVIAALTAFLNTLGLGNGIPYSRLAQVAYDASPGVTNVTSVVLNGGTSDVTITGSQLIKAGTLVVNTD